MVLRFRLSIVQKESGILPYLLQIGLSPGIGKLETRIPQLHQMHGRLFIAPQNNKKQKQ